MTPRARRLRRRQSHGLSTPKKILIGVGVIVGLIAAGIGGVGAWVLDVRANAPDIDELKPIDEGETSFVYAADGTQLGAIQADTLREPVPLKEIPKDLQEATIAIEDENFYEHGGVDYEAIIRAAIKNFEAGEVRQGGSTITQQLARNLYIQNPDDTIERKITEAKLAEEMEDEHSKNWILEQYLNTASYGTNNGRTAVGVEAASQVFFNKSVSDLNLQESALLAGLPQAPSEYNPFSSSDQAKQRRDEVLKKMYEQGYISLSQEKEALQSDLGLQRGYRYESIKGDHYFFDYVEQELIDKYGVNTVRQGGLKVYTTINPRLQTLAKNAVVAGAASLPGPSQALTSIDPTNGHIVAMASSSSYESSKYNLAAQGHRQPGSSFKPFVLATAITQGIDPDTTYYSGTPETLIHDPYNPWAPQNAADGSEGGTMSLRDATVNSVNVVYAKLGLDVGAENFDKMARDLGADINPPDPHPSEAIGGLTIGVSPLGMADAYASFANGGVHHDPTAIARVEFPNGQVDEPEDPEGTRVLTPGEAYTVTDVLEGVITSGTGTAANYCGTGDAEAGKTGTTDNNTDAWFVGYTKNLSTAVWTGYPDINTPMGSDAFGGTYSAPTWADFMRQADPDCEPFDVPTELPDLTSFYGGHTEAKSSPSDYDSNYNYDTTTTGTTSTDTPGCDDTAYNCGDLQNGDGPDQNNGGGNG